MLNPGFFVIQLPPIHLNCIYEYIHQWMISFHLHWDLIKVLIILAARHIISKSLKWFILSIFA